MRTLGLLGGMSWESTQHYYRLLNEGVRERLGGVHSADLVLRSFDFAPLADLQHHGEWDVIADQLSAAAVGLEGAGAAAIVLCTNTMHVVAPQIAAATSIPLLHIGDATGVAVTTVGARRPLLLGTAFTMEQPFLRDHLAQHFGLDVVIPADDDRSLVHAAIYDELVRGIVSPATRMRIAALVHRVQRADGVDAVILGCTELELLLGPTDLPLPWFPTTALHAAAALSFAFDDAAGGSRLAGP
jgi:aspartate racemase